jgi:hypothetical protein
MPPIIQFTQNAITPGPGVAMLGVPALPVLVEDLSTDIVTQRTFEMLDVPLDAATLTGIFGGPGIGTSATFNPDPFAANFGCYRVRVTTVNPSGLTQSSLLNFSVATTQGWILPSFKAKAAELNFGGNVEGWEELLNRIFKWISLNWVTGASGADIEEDVAVNSAVVLGDPVYRTAVNDRVAPSNAAVTATAGVVGVAKTGQAIVGGLAKIVYAGPCTGVLAGATAGAEYWLAIGGGATATPPITAGTRMIRVGYAINATDLMVQIQDYGTLPT